MKASVILLFPALALGAATPKVTIPSIDPSCLKSATSIPDCLKKINPSNPSAVTDVTTCLANIVSGVQKCIPGVPGGLPTGVPGLPVPLPTALPIGLPGIGIPRLPWLS